MAQHMNEIQEWLARFLEIDWFKEECKNSKHSHTIEKEAKRIFFCVVCSEGPFCALERAGSKHGAHEVLQVFKKGPNFAVRVEEAEKFLDLKDIKKYLEHDKYEVYGRAQQQGESPGVGEISCEVCGQVLSEPVKFCSLACMHKVLCNNKGNGNSGSDTDVPANDSQRFNNPYWEGCLDSENQ